MLQSDRLELKESGGKNDRSNLQASIGPAGIERSMPDQMVIPLNRLQSDRLELKDVPGAIVQRNPRGFNRTGWD